MCRSRILVEHLYIVHKLSIIIVYVYISAKGHMIIYRAMINDVCKSKR